MFLHTIIFLMIVELNVAYKERLLLTKVTNLLWSKNYLTRQEISVTNEDDIYTIEKIKIGIYQLTAKSDKFIENILLFKIRLTEQHDLYK